MNTNDEIQDHAQIETAVYALAASPAYEADGICFAATATGLRASRDHGRTFSDAYAGLNLPGALPTPAVALSPRFAADRVVFAGVQGAVLRSYDGGAGWQYAELRSPPPVVTCLAVSPSYEQDGILFAGTLEDGVFRSADRGSRWAAWNFGLIDLGVLCLALSPAFDKDETLVVGTETGLFRSTNGGRAWRELGLPTDLAPILSVAFSPHFAQDGRLYAATESNGLWKSTDQGRSWKPVEALGQGAVNAVVVKGAGENLTLAALADDSVMVSWDDGLTWVAVSNHEEMEPMCLCAPAGLEPGAWLLVGCANGEVKRLLV